MPIAVSIKGNSFRLSPDFALYWQDLQWLIIADAHFSKETHFRKHGIAIPAAILLEDLRRVDVLIKTYAPQRVVFLGDMFHSENNPGIDAFAKWRNGNNMPIDLVIGNHDILDRSRYADLNIDIHEDKIIANNIVLAHDDLSEIPEGHYLLHGHIHPCIRLAGKAKQSMRLPCFWFGKEKGVLPSFGTFTGGHAITPNKTDQVFAIADAQIVRIN